MEPPRVGPGPEGDDWRLLARVAAGEGEALTPLVERHQERLLAVCERLLGDREEARDAVQEVFIKLFRGAAKAEPRGALFTFLYRVAVNHCLNRLRRRRIAKFFSLSGPADPDEDLAFDPPAEDASPERALAERELWRATRRAIDALPPSQRAVLVLAKFEGLSYREIAAALGVTESAVESRLVRAMRHLTAAGHAQEDTGARVSPAQGRSR